MLTAKELQEDSLDTLRQLAEQEKYLQKLFKKAVILAFRTGCSTFSIRDASKLTDYEVAQIIAGK